MAKVAILVILEVETLVLESRVLQVIVQQLEMNTARVKVVASLVVVMGDHYLNGGNEGEDSINQNIL